MSERVSVWLGKRWHLSFLINAPHWRDSHRQAWEKVGTEITFHLGSYRGRMTWDVNSWSISVVLAWMKIQFQFFSWEDSTGLHSAQRMLWSLSPGSEESSKRKGRLSPSHPRRRVENRWPWGKAISGGDAFSFSLSREESFLSNYKASLMHGSSFNRLLEQYLLVDQECFTNDSTVTPWSELTTHSERRTLRIYMRIPSNLGCRKGFKQEAKVTTCLLHWKAPYPRGFKPANVPEEVWWTWKFIKEIGL